MTQVSFFLRGMVLFSCLALLMPVNSAASKPEAQTLPPAGGSLCGLKIGMDKDDAHAVLTAQGVSGGKNAEADKDAGIGKSHGADPDDALPEVWLPKAPPYGKIVFAVDDHDKVLWVTGFARTGQGIPFAQIGNLARAAASGPTFAVWNVISPAGSYREIARGQGGRATTVSLLPLKSANPNGAFSPQIIPKNAQK